MPSDFVFDLDQPYPDVVVDTMRLAMVAAIAEQADHLEQFADSFLLVQTAADFGQTALAAVTTLQATIADQATQIADLETRVAALENPTPAA